MFDDDMNVKVIDFGEAKDITESLGPENYKTDEEASKTIAYDRGD
jgi:3-phosphoinositide dependent protein kinase-1